MIDPDRLFGRLGNRMFQGAYLKAQELRGAIPDIYLQDEKYFKEFEPQVRAMYSQHLGFKDFVAIHVRRGDYVDNPFYVDLLDTDYYQRAMGMFKGEKFLVFSDDIEYCKKLARFQDCEFAYSAFNPSETLNQMASCKHQIIANSSFSWWAAWLNPHPEKKIIAPKAWHPDGIDRTKIPETWIRI